MRALAAYLRWLSEGVTAAQTRAWRGRKIEKPLAKPDPARGRQLYLDKCAACHANSGQGLRIGDVRPGPLWGPQSWNDGAGAARTLTLAAYLRHAMPYSAPGSLTDEEAQLIAAYIDSQPRPAFAAKDKDFLTEPLPADATYYPPRH